MNFLLVEDQHILTWPMAKLSTFWDYIFNRENKAQTFLFRVHWLSEYHPMLMCHFFVVCPGSTADDDGTGVGTEKKT